MLKISHKQLTKLFGEAVTKEIAEANNNVISAIAEAGETMIFSTPVDTSKAISNWQANLTGQMPEVIPPHFPGIGGSTADASATETVESLKDNIEDKQPGQPVTIANPVEYIQELDARVNFEGTFSAALTAALDTAQRKNIKIIMG